MTFLFTDIEGSTALWDVAPEAMRQALELHDGMVRTQIEGHRGYVFATGGDGFAAAFSTAGDALAAAIAIQQALGETAWPQGAPIRVRIGVHSGESWERDGDYFGSVVNITARLMGAAGPGQVLCSDVTGALADAQLDAELVDLGMRLLRGLSAPIRVLGVVADGVARPTIATEWAAGNLPRIPTEFVGRVDQLQQLAALLRARRFVTLTGTGGVGKSRLAVELGSAVAADFADGVWFVDLASVTDPASVAVTAAQTLGLPIGEGRSPLDAVVDALAARRVLMLLDNCEHLLDGCCELVERVLSGCPGVGVLATSREPLGLPGEQVSRVPSLDPEREAVELFLDRARLVDAGFAPTADDLVAIRHVCARLDGIPLAIELAAARLPMFGASGLSARITDRFALLRGGRRGGLERHRTLQATVDWSYRLLDEGQRQAFDACAVFAGGFDIDAAVAVCGGQADEAAIIERLAALVDKSMVATVSDGLGVRYHVLETLRQFGEGRLVDRGELANCSLLHLRHYLQVAVTAGAEFETSSQLHAIEVLDSEWANLRTAHSWALGSGELDASTEIVEATAMYAITRLRHEHLEWTESALAALCVDERAAPSASLSGIVAYWNVLRGNYEDAIRLATDVLGEYRSEGAALFWPLLARHMARFAQGDVDGAAADADALMGVTADGSPYRRLTAAVMRAQAGYVTGTPSVAYEHVVRLAADVDNPAARSFAAGHEAMLAYLSGDSVAALDRFSQAVDHAKGAGLLVLEGGWMTGMAFVLSGMSMTDDVSAEAFGRVLRHAAETRDGLSAWTGLEALAIHLTGRMELEPAAVVLGHLEWANRRTADMAAMRTTALQAVSEDPRVEVWMQRGATMTRDELLLYALDALDRIRSPGSRSPGG